jgi:predicted nucleotidyltransferase
MFTVPITTERQEHSHTTGAYLFGSYAKDTADEWSDIDLALVTDTFIGDSFDFHFMLTKLARRIDSDIESHPYLMSEFNESNPVAGQILKYGERVV